MYYKYDSVRTRLEVLYMRIKFQVGGVATIQIRRAKSGLESLLVTMIESVVRDLRDPLIETLSCKT